MNRSVNLAGKSVEELWAIARNTQLPPATQQAAATAALRQQNGVHGSGRQEESIVDLVDTLANAAGSFLGALFETVEGRGAPDVASGVHSRAGGTTDRSPEATALKLLQRKYADAVTLQAPGDLKRTVPVGEHEFVVTREGLNDLVEVEPPRGFEFAVTAATSEALTITALASRIICRRADELPEVHPASYCKYFEVERTPGDPCWIVYELKDTEQHFFEQLAQAQSGPAPRKAVTRLLTDQGFEAPVARELAKVLVESKHRVMNIGELQELAFHVMYAPR